MYKDCLDTRRRVSGPDHHSSLSTINNLANNYRAQGDYEITGGLYENRLDIMRQVMGLDHPDTLCTINNLANYCKDLRKPDAADTLYKLCLDIRDHLDYLQYLL